MKTFKSCFAASFTFCAALFVLSCRKQITEPREIQPPIKSQANNTTQCKPAALCVNSFYPSSPDNREWTTLAQKWYDNGKVKYLKAKHAGYTSTVLDPFLELFDLNWGEVSYEGNQVYLEDVINNRLLLRVTLDNYGRPVASYYHNGTGPGDFVTDTSYYYYQGNRLDYILSLYVTTVDVQAPYSIFRKFIFSYDSWGNLIKVDRPGSMRFNIQYDYGKPVTGIINNFQLTSSLKLLEYMELINLPMHFAVTRTDFQVAFMDTYSEIRYSSYKDYVISNGLVQSYVYDDPYRSVTFYNGWECGTSQLNSTNLIQDFKQLQQLYRQ